MDKFDFTTFYNEKVKATTAILSEEFNKILLANPDHEKQPLLDSFCIELRIRKIQLYESSIATEATSNPIDTKKNEFIKAIIESFSHRIKKYKINQVANFLKEDLPEFRKLHLGLMSKDLLSNSYSFRSEFINDASDETIVELIAISNALQSFDYENATPLMYLGELGSKAGSSATIASNIKWTGGRNKRNEFLKLIYGLYHAGYINNGQGGILKVVNYLNDVFEAELNTRNGGWEKNFSDNILYTNKSIEEHLEIFDQAKNALKKHITNRKLKELNKNS